MTTPVVQHISIRRGDDVTLTLTFDQAVAGFAEIWFTVRADYATTETDDSGAVFSGSLTGGQITATGTYTADVFIPNATTVAMTADQYAYDAQIRTGAGRLHTTQTGLLRMLPDVTR